MNEQECMRHHSRLFIRAFSFDDFIGVIFVTIKKLTGILQHSAAHGASPVVICALMIFLSSCAEDRTLLIAPDHTPSQVCEAEKSLSELPKTTRTGGGYYGIQNPLWPCEDSLAIFSKQKHPSVSVLFNVFGTKLACLKKFIADPRRKTVEIHLVNGCCQRSNNCQPYDFLYGISNLKERELIALNNQKFKEALLRYIAPIVKLVANSQNTNTRFIISPELESNMPCSAGQRLIAWLKPTFPPTTKFAWTAMQGCLPKGADFREYHGYTSKLEAPCIANLDGNDIALPIASRCTSTKYPHIEYNQISHYLENTSACTASFLWVYEMNGGEYNGGSDDRRSRTNWPSKQVFTVLEPFFK